MYCFKAKIRNDRLRFELINGLRFELLKRVKANIETFGTNVK